MSTIEFCPECGGVVVGTGTDLRCTSCGLTYDEMIDSIDHDEDDFLEDDDADLDELDDELDGSDGDW
jgi:DNA-directed RNA polymerase subunit M/transcription elongation factor TFIIS